MGRREYHLSIYDEYFILVDVDKVWTHEDGFWYHLRLYTMQELSYLGEIALVSTRFRMALIQIMT